MTHRLTRHDSNGSLVDLDGEALGRLGVEDVAQYVVRPDGHVAFRCAGRELSETVTYLHRWFFTKTA
jgi:hypothetical protein